MKPEAIKSKNDWNEKIESQSKQIYGQTPYKKHESIAENKFKVNNKDTRTT